MWFENTTLDLRTGFLLPFSAKLEDVLPVEFHSHSGLSYDGHDPVEKLFDRARRAVLDGISDGNASIRGSRTPYRVTFRQAAGSTKRRVKRQFF